MTRTERLEAAMRTAMDMLRRPKNQHSNGEAAATILEVALADTSLSCCEEVRRATLEDAAKYVELEWEFDRPASGVRTPNGERARRVAAGIRALSNQAPRKSLFEAFKGCTSTVLVSATPPGAPPKSHERCGIDFHPFGLPAESFIESCKCTLPVGHLGHHKWIAPTVGPPTMLVEAPPVCPTCGNSKVVAQTNDALQGIRNWEPCPDCAGGEK